MTHAALILALTLQQAAAADAVDTPYDRALAAMESAVSDPCDELERSHGRANIEAMQADLVAGLLHLYGASLDQDADRLGLAEDDRVRVTARGASWRADQVSRTVDVLQESAAAMAYAHSRFCPGR